MPTMPLTRLCRESAISQPEVPDMEWVRTIAGADLSSSAATAAWFNFSLTPPSLIPETCEAKN